MKAPPPPFIRKVFLETLWLKVCLGYFSMSTSLWWICTSSYWGGGGAYHCKDGPLTGNFELPPKNSSYWRVSSKVKLIVCRPMLTLAKEASDIKVHWFECKRAYLKCVCQFPLKTSMEYHDRLKLLPNIHTCLSRLRSLLAYKSSA